MKYNVHICAHIMYVNESHILNILALVADIVHLELFDLIIFLKVRSF